MSISVRILDSSATWKVLKEHLFGAVSIDEHEQQSHHQEEQPIIPCNENNMNTSNERHVKPLRKIEPRPAVNDSQTYITPPPFSGDHDYCLKHLKVNFGLFYFVD